MNELALPSSGLTAEEVNFVFNAEVLGLPSKKAAELAGMPYSRMSAQHIVQARELAKRELRGATQITKEDVVYGMHDAIGRAKILAEPMTEIIGWEKIAKLLGYDQPQKIDINIRASVEAAQQHVRALSDPELIALLGANDVIDADFYEVPKARS